MLKKELTHTQYNTILKLQECFHQQITQILLLATRCDNCLHCILQMSKKSTIKAINIEAMQSERWTKRERATDEWRPTDRPTTNKKMLKKKKQKYMQPNPNCLSVSFVFLVGKINVRTVCPLMAGIFREQQQQQNPLGTRALSRKRSALEQITAIVSNIFFVVVSSLGTPIMFASFMREKKKRKIIEIRQLSIFFFLFGNIR